MYEPNDDMWDAVVIIGGLLTVVLVLVAMCYG